MGGTLPQPAWRAVCGTNLYLSESNIHGYGKIRGDDSTWKIEGADCPAGSEVKVVGADGVVLKVEQI